MIGQHVFTNVMLRQWEKNRRPLLKGSKDEDNYKADLLNIFHWVDYILVRKHRDRAQRNVTLELLFTGKDITIVGARKEKEKGDPAHLHDISNI